MRFFSCHALLILLGIDKAALLISEVKEKSSILGNIFVVL